jgi:hypothetical protein
MTPISIVLPLRIQSLNAKLSALHPIHRGKRTAEERFVTRAALWGVRPRLREVVARGSRLAITLTRIAPRWLDDDNLAGACKAVRDGVADAIGLDDRDHRLRWAYLQATGARPVRGTPATYAVRITIEEAA